MGRKIEAFVSNDDFSDERKAKTMWNYHAELEKILRAIRLNRIDWCEICCHSKLPT